jgi:hypothetical protein
MDTLLASEKRVRAEEGVLVGEIFVGFRNDPTKESW